MSTKKEKKLARKRKAKQQKNMQSKKQSMAYSGMKYKSEELIPFVFETERAIHEAFVICGRDFTDHHVRRALESMIEKIRQNRISIGEQVGQSQSSVSVEEFIICNILFHWHDYFETSANPGRDKAVGVLRTILYSVDVWSSPNPESRGYLDYLQGFLRKLGAEVHEVSREQLIEIGFLESQLP